MSPIRFVKALPILAQTSLFLAASRKSLAPLSILVASAVFLSGCSWISGSSRHTKLSPKVVHYGQEVPKGGGRYKVGSPYEINGVRFYPREDPNYNRVGVASWYGHLFHGRYTANGEIYDMDALTAAHPTLPLPSYVKVTNLENGRSLVVRVNDRGPYAHDRIIDMSRKSAGLLGFQKNGTARVRVKYLSRAPLNGNDRYERQYLASQPWWRGSRKRRFTSRTSPRRYTRRYRQNRRYASRPQTRHYQTPRHTSTARRPRSRTTKYYHSEYDNITVGSLPRERRYSRQTPIYRARSYSVQIGTFRNRNRARIHSGRHAHLGRTYIKTVNGRYGRAHKVLVGPYRSRSQAVRAWDRIYNYGVYDAIIVRK